jgi:ankyrin repeat protein
MDSIQHNNNVINQPLSQTFTERYSSSLWVFNEENHLQTGETPLHLACRSCRADVVRHLITFVREKKGAEVAKNYVNAVNDEGAGALHYTAQITKDEVEEPLSDKEVMKLLLDGGADVGRATRQVRLLLL